MYHSSRGEYAGKKLGKVLSSPRDGGLILEPNVVKALLVRNFGDEVHRVFATAQEKDLPTGFDKVDGPVSGKLQTAKHPHRRCFAEPSAGALFEKIKESVDECDHQSQDEHHPNQIPETEGRDRLQFCRSRCIRERQVLFVHVFYTLGTDGRRGRRLRIARRLCLNGQRSLRRCTLTCFTRMRSASVLRRYRLRDNSDNRNDKNARYENSGFLFDMSPPNTGFCGSAVPRGLLLLYITSYYSFFP